MAPRLAAEQQENAAAGNNSSISSTETTNNELSALLPKSQEEGDIDHQAEQEQLATLGKARRMLYLSHLFSQFSEVAWQFCLILFLAAFANYNSLILVSSYGLVSNGSVVMFGAKAGRFVDGGNRLFVAQRFIFTENCAVMLASFLCYLLLAKNGHGSLLDSPVTPSLIVPEEEDNHHHNNPTLNAIAGWFASRFDEIPLDIVSICLLVGIHILGATAMILDSGFLVAMERDWIVVMSQYAAPASRNSDSCNNSTNGNPTDHPASKKWLCDTNVTMKQIDLSCKVVSPAIAGFLLSAFDDGEKNGSDLKWAAILVGAINAVALVVEYICTLKIYHMIPALAIQSKDVEPAAGGRDEEEVQEGQQSSQLPLHYHNNKIAPTNSNNKLLSVLPSSMQIYWDQSIAMGGFSLALLYLNVLTFGGIMTAYLVWRGMRLDTIGVWRGVSSAIGLLGTFVYHFLAKRTHLVNTGMWSITYQFVCISMSYISLFIENYNLSLTMLILGVCSSRIGLWVFDISITQLMQEQIPDGIRGVVGGVQQSMNSSFVLVSFALGIVFPDPKQFYIYVSAGYASVGLAMILYFLSVYVRKEMFVQTE